jgi:hypothetical protein
VWHLLVQLQRRRQQLSWRLRVLLHRLLLLL